MMFTYEVQGRQGASFTAAGWAREKLARALERASNGRGMSMMEARGIAREVLESSAAMLLEELKRELAADSKRGRAR